MSSKEQSRTRALVVLGGATLVLGLLLTGRRTGNGGNDGRARAPGAAAGTGPQPASEEVRIWLRSGDRIELDGVSSDLPTTIAQARSVGRAIVHATGDARVGWIRRVINELRAANVTLRAEAGLFSDADHLHALAAATSSRLTSEAARNASTKRRGQLPRYDQRKGSWTGGDTRTLYTFADPATGRVWVVPGGYLMLYGPQATVRVSSRDEAEEHWQSPLHEGWRVAST
jgi:hypothetical protein